jgi:transposase InsO family protein
MKRNAWPKGAQATARSGVLAAIDLSVSALHAVRAKFETSGDPLARATARCDRLDEQVRALEQLVALLLARLKRVPVRQRPHFTPSERNEILMLMVKMGWTTKQIARRVLVAAETISSWRRALRTTGTEAFIAPRQPINKFNDAVAVVVKTMHAAATHLGKRAEAAQLLHAGLKISASSVWRLKQRRTPTPPKPMPAPKSPAHSPVTASSSDAVRKPPQRVTAKRANHVWHIDSTVVTVRHTPVANILAPACWPMAWHVVVVVDHFTRGFVGFGVFKKAPTGAQVARVLKRAAVDAGTAPAHIISDRGAPFMSSDYDEWCAQNKVRQRYGAIGQHGSIAVVERFIRTLKREHLRRLLIPRALVASIRDYQRWYNEHRPHSFLGGLTPDEKQRGQPYPISRRRFEPRANYPIDQADTHVVRADLELHVEHLNGHRHLPLFTLRAAA